MPLRNLFQKTDFMRYSSIDSQSSKSDIQKQAIKMDKKELIISSFTNCNWFEQWIHQTITYELRELICHSHKNLKNYCSKFSIFILYVFWIHYFHLTPHFHNYSPISHAIKIFWFFSHFFSRSFRSSDLLYFLNFFKKFLFIKSRNHCLFVYGFNILKNKS